MLQAKVLPVFDVVFLKQVLYLYYFLLRCSLRTKFTESWDKWNTKKLWLMCFHNATVVLSVQACLQLVFKVLLLKQVLFHTYLDVALEQSFQSPGGNVAFTSIYLELYTV